MLASTLAVLAGAAGLMSAPGGAPRDTGLVPGSTERAETATTTTPPPAPAGEVGPGPVPPSTDTAKMTSSGKAPWRSASTA